MRTPDQLNRVIRKYVKKWKAELRLWNYSIDTQVRTYIPNTAQTGIGNGVGANCTSDWRYLTANMDFSFDLMGDMEEADIEKIVLHEMLHICVNEMRYEGIEHEERVVTELTTVISRLAAK